MTKDQFRKMVEKKQESLWEEMIESMDSAEQDLKRLTELRNFFQEVQRTAKMFGLFRAQCQSVIEACNNIIRSIQFGKALVLKRLEDYTK